MQAVRRVLIVDDEPPITDALRELFELNDFDAVGAYDRRGAEALLRRQTFSVVLADLRLTTEEEGLALLDAIRELNRDAQVVTITGHATVDAERQVAARGVSKILHKPLAFEEILETIQLLAERDLDGQRIDADALYEDSRRILHGIAIRRFGFSADEADELVQEAWALFLEKRREIRQARAWLAGTVANLCRHEIERNRRARNRDAEIERLSARFERSTAPAIEEILALRQVLERTDARTRDLCTLIAIEGFSYDEVASELGMPIGSIGPLYIRARKKLRKEMEGDHA